MLYHYYITQGRWELVDVIIIESKARLYMADQALLQWTELEAKATPMFDIYMYVIILTRTVYIFVYVHVYMYLPLIFLVDFADDLINH